MKHSKIEMLLGQFMKSMAGFMAPAVHDVCRLWWYQPEEPNGFEEFAKSLNNNN